MRTPILAALILQNSFPAIEHARRFSAECAAHLVDANVNIKNAKSELEAAYEAAKKQTFPAPPNKALDYPKTAQGLLARR